MFQSLHTRVWRMKSVFTSCHSWHKNICKSKQKGHGQKMWPIVQKACRSATTNGENTRLISTRLGLWVVGMANKPPSSLRSKTTCPWSTTKHNTDKLRDPKARHAAETFGNSKRTRAWMIIECSNDDVQVLRTVKNGVSTGTLI